MERVWILMYFVLHPISSLNHLAARLVTDQITLIASIILFVFLSLNYKKENWQRIDQLISEWAVTSKETFVKKHSEDFSMFGNAVFHIALSLLLSIVFFLLKHKFSIVISIFFALIFSWGFNRLLKLVYKRTRPGNSHSIKRLSYCFPSGHVMASIPIYFFNATLLQSLLPFLPWYLIALAISYAVIMSRIYLNHHYFTDVIAGIFMGIFCLSISIWFYFFVGLI